MDDWIGHFRVQDIGLNEGAYELLLTAVTRDDRDLEGRDTVALVGRRARI